MKNNDLPERYNALTDVQLENFDLKKIIIKNMRLMREEIEVNQQLIHKDYEGERVKLAISNSRKDKTGQPIMVGNSYDIIDMAKFNKQLEILRAKYHYSKYEEIMEKECAIQFITISKEDFKAEINTMPLGLLELLIDWIV